MTSSKPELIENFVNAIQPSPEPTEDELLAMAYADGELAPEARREAAKRISTEDAFALRVAHYQRLDVTTRTATSSEPQDTARAKLAEEPLQRATLGFGWVSATLGFIAFYAWIFYEILQNEEMSGAPKIFLLCAAGGLFLLFLSVLRGRLRELPYDPYTDLER